MASEASEHVKHEACEAREQVQRKARMVQEHVGSKPCKARAQVRHKIREA